MSWLEKLLPPRIKRAGTPGGGKRTVPEGVWVKCSACDAVLYRADLETNLNVCRSATTTCGSARASGSTRCSTPRAASRSARRWCRSTR